MLGYLERHRGRGEIPTGLLFIDENWPEMHAIAGTAKKPLKNFDYEQLNPGSAALPVETSPDVSMASA